MGMLILQALIVPLIIFALAAAIVIQFLRNSISGIKLMLLGINITLLGGILLIDPNRNHGFIAYIAAFLGVVISIIGFGKKE